MASPSEKLAHSLESLQKLQESQGTVAIRSKDLTRTDRKRLLKNGFLQEVMKRLAQIDKKLLEHDNVIEDLVHNLIPLLEEPSPKEKPSMGFNSVD